MFIFSFSYSSLATFDVKLHAAGIPPQSMVYHAVPDEGFIVGLLQWMLVASMLGYIRTSTDYGGLWREEEGWYGKDGGWWRKEGG